MKSFIRYLYEYQNGKRTRNTGFVKVLEQEEATVVQIYGRGFPVAGGRTLEIYLFYEEDGQCIGILMGEIRGAQAAFGYKLSYTTDDVGGDGQFGRIGGMILRVGNGADAGYYGAVWDEARPVDVSRMITEEGMKPQQVAGTAYEGTYIHKRGGYYYLFASIGRCCEGLKSTYTTVVGRSKHLFGPYVDKKGESMLENHHEVLIDKNEAFVGPGHNSEIVTDDKGADWMFYHAVSVANPEGRVLMLDRVNWKKGWPVVEGDTPSLQAKAPVIRHK